jgi:hypothetical protein
MDMFTFSIKVEATERAGYRLFGQNAGRSIATRTVAISQLIASRVEPAKIREVIIGMRSWAFSGNLRAAGWLDNRLDELAGYLDSPEDAADIDELVSRFARNFQNEMEIAR